MDKRNSTQKNKSKNGKKPASQQPSALVVQEQSAVKDEAATFSGKKSNSGTQKKR